LVTVDFPYSDYLRQLLASRAAQEWMLQHIHGGAYPAWGENGSLCLRIEDDSEAELFRERWLSQL
jgi:hypothetical protein